MAAYRVYCLDGANHFVRPEPLDATGDDDAYAWPGSSLAIASRQKYGEGSR
jgi:hypothetical protein